MNVSSITLYEDQVEWLHMNGSDGRKVIINALKYYLIFLKKREKNNFFFFLYVIILSVGGILWGI